MASALCRDLGVRTENGNLVLTLECALSGNAQTEIGGGGYTVMVDVPLMAADQPAAIRTKMSNAVVAHALGLGLTIVPTDITLPQFQKG